MYTYETAVDSAGEQSETEPLLSAISHRPGRRPHRISHGSYGAVSSESPSKSHFIALNAPPPGSSSSSDGVPIRRQESILKVRAWSSARVGRALTCSRQLAGLIDDRAGEFEHFRKSEEELKKMKKAVRAFYVEQNEILVRFGLDGLGARSLLTCDSLTGRIRRGR